MAGAEPKYRRLRGVLAELAATELQPGDAIPSERTLMGRFGVSRATVRAAIAELVQEGVLHNVHGRGTFVAERRVTSRLHLASFSEDMARRGLVPETRVLDAREIPADDELAAQLAIDVGRPCARVERLRLADGRPMAFERGHYPLDRVPGLLDHDLTRSIYRLLADHHRRPLDGGEQELGAEPATSSFAELLAVPPGAPLLWFRRRATSRGEPIEWTTSWYRADRYRVSMTLGPDRPAAPVTPP